MHCIKVHWNFDNCATSGGQAILLCLEVGAIKNFDEGESRDSHL
jgi:hypothetical protein